MTGDISRSVSTRMRRILVSEAEADHDAEVLDRNFGRNSCVSRRPSGCHGPGSLYQARRSALLA